MFNPSVHSNGIVNKKYSGRQFITSINFKSIYPSIFNTYIKLGIYFSISIRL